MIGSAAEGMMLMVSIIASIVTLFVTIWYNIPPMIGVSLGFAYCAYSIYKTVSDRELGTNTQEATE